MPNNTWEVEFHALDMTTAVNKICPKCGNGNYIFAIQSREFPYKCANCDSYLTEKDFEYEEQYTKAMVDLWLKDDAPEWVRHKIEDELRRKRYETCTDISK